MKNKRGFTLVEVLVSFILIMIVMVYLLRTIISISTKNNELVTLQEYTTYESTLLDNVYKDVDKIFTSNEFSGLTSDESTKTITFIDIDKKLIIKDSENSIIYDNVVYALPENISFRQHNGKIYDVIEGEEQHDYYIVRIYVTVYDIDDNIDIIYQNKNAHSKTITFYGNGGTPEKRTFVKKGTSRLTAFPSEPVYPGYNFIGWYTQALGGDKLESVDDIPNTTGNLEYFAHWEEVNTGEPYTIRFNKNANDAIGEMIDLQTTSGVNTKLTANAFTRSGYAFVNWNLNSDGSGREFSNEQTVSDLSSYVDANGIVNLYAQWEHGRKVYARFSTNSADAVLESTNTNLALDGYIVTLNGKQNFTTYEYGQTGIDLPNYNDPNYINIKRTGYHAEDGKEWVIKVGTKYYFFNQNDTSTNANDLCDASENACTATLMVNWKGNPYTIKFNGNTSTSGSMSNLSMTYGKEKNLTANAYEKNGYTFNGWNTNSNGSGTNYADKQSVKNLTTTQNNIVNLYAKWKVNSYTIKFNKNSSSATGSMSDMSVNYNETKALSENKFKRTGYKFKGWATSSNGNVVYSDKQNIKNLKTSGSITLYAVWEANKVLVKFHINGGTWQGSTNSDLSVSGNYVTLNGSQIVAEYNYGQTGINLANYNNADYINIKKTGYHGDTGKEWTDGTNYFSQSSDSIKANDLCNAANGDCTAILKVNWKINTVNVRFNVNGGSFASTHSSSYTISNSLITKNGSNVIHTVNYGESLGSDGLLNYNNPSYVNLVKKGNYVVSGSEWNTNSSGTGTTFNQSTAYTAKQLCSTIETGNCTVTLYVKWRPKVLTVKFNRNTSTSDGAVVSQEFEYGKAGNRFGYNTDGTSKWGTSGAFGDWTNGSYSFDGWNTTYNSTYGIWSAYSNVSNDWILEQLNGSNTKTINLYMIWLLESQSPLCGTSSSTTRCSSSWFYAGTCNWRTSEISSCDGYYYYYGQYPATASERCVGSQISPTGSGEYSCSGTRQTRSCTTISGSDNTCLHTPYGRVN